MTRPVEAVLEDARRRLETTGRLDVNAYLSAYPEHAGELKELLPVMLTLHEERRWQAAERESHTFARGLSGRLAAGPEAGAQTEPGGEAATVGGLFLRDRSESGLSLEEQARRIGLPAEALDRLSTDDTPLSALDNAGIKSLAARVSAPFSALAKEVRRLLSLESLGSGRPEALFTRDSETSTEDEQEALRRRVRSSRRSQRKE